MQEKKRSNQARTEKTKSDLMSAARRLFVEKGYGETSTPEIVAAAGITRGALYHHFEDKHDLFKAVVAEEAEAVAQAIEAATIHLKDPLEAVLAGGSVYLDAMQIEGRTRLLLIEAPAVLGQREMIALDDENAARTLRDGLGALLKGRVRKDFPLQVLSDVLSAAFDRAALTIAAGGKTKDVKRAVEMLVRNIARGEAREN